MSKKRYIGIIVILAGFMCAGSLFTVSRLSAAKHQQASNSNITYDTFVDAGQTDMTEKGTDEYRKIELETRLQETIGMIAEGSDPLVTIDHFDAADSEESAVSVTLCADPKSPISEEQLEGIERLVSKSVSGIPSVSITVTDKGTEN